MKRILSGVLLAASLVSAAVRPVPPSRPGGTPTIQMYEVYMIAGGQTYEFGTGTLAQDLATIRDLAGFYAAFPFVGGPEVFYLVEVRNQEK